MPQRLCPDLVLRWCRCWWAQSSCFFSGRKDGAQVSVTKQYRDRLLGGGFTYLFFSTRTLGKCWKLWRAYFLQMSWSHHFRISKVAIVEEWLRQESDRLTFWQTDMTERRGILETGVEILEWQIDPQQKKERKLRDEGGPRRFLIFLDVVYLLIFLKHVLFKETVQRCLNATDHDSDHPR